ncbi:MAG: alcohol dehydrogenase catalytic domain-containing protein [Candidatus Limnocylindria bacterium]
MNAEPAPWARAIPETMRAVLMTALGGPEHLEIGRLPTPHPGRGEVLVAVRTVAANRTDIFTMRGNAATATPLPHVLGLDPAGVVAEVGPEVTRLEPGDRVVVKPTTACGRCAYCTAGDDDACPDLEIIGVHRQGGMAEFVAVPEASAVRLPDNVGFAEATAIAHSFPVALTMLRKRLGVGPEDTVLVTGAAGAVGAASVQLAKLAGARVIAAAGGRERTQYAGEMGADVVIDYRAKPDFAGEIRDAAGDGVTAYIESAGDPDIWSESLKAMARRGRVVVCGAHAGGAVRLDLAWLFRSRVSITGHSGSTLAAFEEVLELAREGRVRPNIHTVLPLERVREAFGILLAHQNRGKVVLQVAAE